MKQRRAEELDANMVEEREGGKHTHTQKKKKEREKEKQCSKKVDRYRHYLEKHVKSRDVSGKSEDTLLFVV